MSIYNEDSYTGCLERNVFEDSQKKISHLNYVGAYQTVTLAPINSSQG